MFWEATEDFFVPAPVFEHLAGGFDKVSLDAGAVESRQFDTGTHVVHGVSKFVEEGDDFVMFQETRFVARRFGEIGYHPGDGELSGLFGYIVSGLQIPAGGVRVFSGSWEQVQVKVSHEKGVIGEF